MPYSKKQYSLGLVFIVSVITLALLNSYFYNNSPFLENQEEIINNNDHQEENIREFNHHLSLLDNTIVNFIIFLLIFVFAFLFVYFAPISPVARNNQENTILDQTKTKINKSVLRKTGLFNGENYNLRKDNFYLYYEVKNEVNTNNNNPNPVSRELRQIMTFETKNVNDKNNVAIYDYEGGVLTGNQVIKKYISKYKIDIKSQEEFNKIIIESVAEKKKRDSIENRIKNNPNIQVAKVYQENCAQEIKDFCNSRKPNYQKFYNVFQGKPNFFNFDNIFAFLLSSGFFFVSFFLPYFIFYFLYVLIYILFFIDGEAIEEENKWLFAFHKAWDAVIFSNFGGLLKIIILIVFLIKILFVGYLFFGNHNMFFTPKIIDKKKENFLMLIHQYGDKFEKFLKGELTKIPFNCKYKGAHFVLGSSSITF